MHKSYLLWRGEDTDEEFAKIMTFLDEIKPEDEVRFYINSGGGRIWFFETILSRLNQLIDLKYKITLNIIFAASAALILAWKFKWQCICEYQAECIAHITALDIWPTYGPIVRCSDPVERARLTWYGAQPQMKFSFLTPDEQTRYDSGEDIWINPERTRIIFHNRIHPCSIDSSTLSSCAGPVLSSSGTETIPPWNWLSTPQEPESGIPEQLPT